MVRLFRWLFGYVDFMFWGGFADGFVNECFQNKINLHHITRRENTIYAECPAGAYASLRPMARRHGGRLKVIKRHGPLFPLLRLRNRWGLFVGLTAGVLLVSFLSGFFWNIEITGNEKIPTQEITSFLAENGFAKGVWRKSVDKDRLENLMLASFDDCSWVHINEFGTTARVEINETIAKPEVVSKEAPSNLKAVKDGIIVKATVYDGWQTAKVGDSVVKGDLLVSGVYESEKKKVNLFAHADGEYLAQVREPFTHSVSRQQSYRSYTSSRTFKTLHFFGIQLPLYLGTSTLPNSDESVSSNYLTLNGTELPIGVAAKTVRSYTVTTRVLSDKELTELMQSEIQAKLEKDYAGAEILKQDIDIALNAEEAAAKGTITCLENIGEVVTIKIKN